MRFTLEIKKVIDQTRNVKTFVFDKPKNFKFTAGQYCLVSLPTVPQTMDESRPFTFSSSPTYHEIELTFKKKGDFTVFMFGLEVGDKIELSGPFGESLNFDESVKDDLVLVAGGSGITPFMSILRYIVEKDLKNNVILIYSNRTKQDIIYKDELEEIEKNNSNIKVIHCLTREKWEGESGRINKDTLLKYVKKPKNRLWYVCGPPKMVGDLRKIVLDMGVSEERLRIEDWQLD
jgi:ferredoxin-NADP reductase